MSRSRLIPPGTPEAAQVTVGSCDFCAGVHINLLDADGAVFATALIPPQTVELFIDGMRAAQRQAAQRQATRHAAPEALQ